MNNPVRLVGSSIMTTGTGLGITTFASTIDGGFALNVTTGGLTQPATGLFFGGAVGATTPLTSIVVDAPYISINGNHTVTQGPMTYGGPITILQATTFTDVGANGMTFQSSVGAGLGVTVGGITGNFPVVLTASGSTITVEGDINTSMTGTDGRSVQITALSHITIEGDIITTGVGSLMDIGFDGGDVQITSEEGNITVESIDVSGSNGTAAAGSAASILLQPGTGFTSTSLGNIPNGKVILAGSPSELTALRGDYSLLTMVPGTDGLITLASASRGGALSVASITSSLSGNSVVILGGSFSVGMQEVITVFGSLEIDMSASLTVGDVVVRDTYAIGSTVTSPFTISLNTHGDIDILNYQGDFDVSPSVHFISRHSGTLNGTITPASSANIATVSFSSPEFQSQLIYAPQSLILNYDTDSSPVPPPPPDPAIAEAIRLRPSVINSFNVANAEMFYLLQYWPMSWWHQPRICFTDRKTCVSDFPTFQSWLPYNDVH